MSQHQFKEPNQFTLAIKCHWCGHCGSTLWENTEAGRQIVSVDGFYERITKKRPFRIEKVCNACGKAQPV